MMVEISLTPFSLIFSIEVSLRLIFFSFMTCEDLKDRPLPTKVTQERSDAWSWDLCPSVEKTDEGGETMVWRDAGRVLEKRRWFPGSAAGMNLLIGSGSLYVSCVKVSIRMGFEPHTWKQQGFMGNGRRRVQTHGHAPSHLVGPPLRTSLAD